MGKYNKQFAPFYESREWRELRRTVMINNNYLCAECKKKGIIKQAKCVHHKIFIEDDMSKALEYENLEPLCNECHNNKHERRSDLQRFMEEWEK